MKKNSFDIKIARYRLRKRTLDGLARAMADKMFVESATDQELAKHQKKVLSREAELIRIQTYITNAQKWLANNPQL